MALTLPSRPAQYFIDEILVPEWDRTEARGFDTHKRLILRDGESETIASGDTEAFDSVFVADGAVLTVDGTLETAELTVKGTIDVNGTVRSERDLFVGLSDPSAEAFLPVATSIDDVGAVYPSLIVQYSNETSGGESTYDFMTPDGPGQTRTGELIVTARAQDREEDYTGDAAAYAAAEADDIVVELIEAVENVVQRHAAGGTTEFATLGSQRGPDIPDDYEEDPPVRLADVQVSYSWTRRP